MQSNSLSLDRIFRFSVGGSAAAGCRTCGAQRPWPSAVGSVSVALTSASRRFAVLSRSPRRPGDRRFSLQICTTEFTNPTRGIDIHRLARMRRIAPPRSRAELRVPCKKRGAVPQRRPKPLGGFVDAGPANVLRRQSPAHKRSEDGPSCRMSLGLRGLRRGAQNRGRRALARSRRAPSRRGACSRLPGGRPTASARWCR
jgi:hypothetical protein